MNIHVKLLAGTAFLALAATHSAPALAQSDDAPREADEGNIIVLGARNALTTESETGSRLDISPLETPATVNTLDGDAIRARGQVIPLQIVLGARNAGSGRPCRHSIQATGAVLAPSGSRDCWQASNLLPKTWGRPLPVQFQA